MEPADRKMKSPVDQEPSVVKSVEERLLAMSYQPASMQSASIFKVPHTIRSANPEAYEPKYVGIGLFYSNLNLPEGHPTIAAESHKLQYFLDLHMRNQSRTWKDYVDAIRGEPLEYLSYYSEKIPASTILPEVLLEGMVLDACFILELFMKAADEGRNLQGDPIYGTPWLIQQIAYDLLLLENQLPFDLLKSVYAVFRGPGPFPSLFYEQKVIDLALGFFNMWFTKKDSSSAGVVQTSKTNPAGSTSVDVISALAGHQEEKDSSSAGVLQTSKTNPAGSTRVDVSAFGGDPEEAAVALEYCKTNPAGSTRALEWLREKALIMTRDKPRGPVNLPPRGRIISGLLADIINPLKRIRAVKARDKDKKGGGAKQLQQSDQERANDVLHLLHLFYHSFFDLDPPKNDKKSNYLCFPFYRYTNYPPADEEENLPNHQKVAIPTVTHLRDAGVKFCKGKRANHLAIKFINGRLEIPFFLLEETSDSVIRNLIAFEQCCRPSIYQHNYSLSLYAYFMSRLVNTENDVQIMRESGVFEHFLGSDEEAAKFFTKLCHGIVIDFRKTYLGQVCEQLNQYYQFRPHKWRANLMRDYFTNPWSILSLLAALVLLLLTLLQTLYSVLSYKNSD